MVDSHGQAEDALGKPMPLQSYLSLPNDQKFANTFGRHFFNVIEETGSVRALNLPSEDLVSSGNHERGGNLNKYSSERGRCILTMFVSVSMTLCILITLSLLLQPGPRSLAWTEFSLFGMRLWRRINITEGMGEMWFKDFSE